MPQNIWAALSDTFSPFDPVPPSRLNSWFVTRPDSPLEVLLRHLAPDRVPIRQIFVGQPASGKSSELTKLAAELKSRYDSFVVRFDMTDNIDVERANPVEVIFLMGAAIYKVASAELPQDKQPDRHLLDNLKRGLESIVVNHTANKNFSIDLDKLLMGMVVFGGAALAGPVGGAAGLIAGQGVVSAVRPLVEKLIPFRFTSGTSLEVVRKLEVEPHVETMIEALNAIIDDVRFKLNRLPVLIVDGLDKLRDSSVISLNFLEKNFLNGPKCSVLYAGPLDLYYSPAFGEVRARFNIIPFPHVKLRAKLDPTNLHAAGYEVMTNVAHRRIVSLNLKPEEIIEEGVLNLLIKGSGGVMRDFIRLFRAAAIHAEVLGKQRIEESEALKALNELRRQLAAQLTPDYYDVLNQVRETHQRVGGDMTDKCDQLLRNDIVLSYVNDDVWFDAHSALTPNPW